MKKVYKAHPLMILTYMKPFLFVLVLPFIRGLVQYFNDREVTSILGIELFLFGVITAYAILSHAAFRLVLRENTVMIRSGIVFVRRATINITSLSSVQSERGPIDAVFKSVTYNINTEAGRRNKSDFRFKLHLRDSKEISSILYGEDIGAKLNFSPLKIAILAATTSSAFSGLIIGVPIINKIGDLLGLAIYDMLFDEINNVSNKFQTFFPPIVNVITLVFLLAYSISFVYSFLKYVNFRLYLGENKLEIRSGFITRTRTAFKKSSVNDVRIDQTALMMLIRRFAMKVSIGGYGDNKSESEVIIPSGTLSEIRKSFSIYFPFLESKGNKLKSKQDIFNKSRFLVMPSVYLIGVITVAIILAKVFTDFEKLILFMSAILLIIVFYYAHISLCESRYSKLILGDNICIQSTKGLRTSRLYCPKENIGEIKITRFFTDFPQNTCRVRLTVRSESADSIRVRMFDYSEVLKELSENFNIQV